MYTHNRNKRLLTRIIKIRSTKKKIVKKTNKQIERKVKNTNTKQKIVKKTKKKKKKHSKKRKKKQIYKKHKKKAATDLLHNIINSMNGHHDPTQPTHIYDDAHTLLLNCINNNMNRRKRRQVDDLLKQVISQLNITQSKNDIHVEPLEYIRIHNIVNKTNEMGTTYMHVLACILVHIQYGCNINIYYNNNKCTRLICKQPAYNIDITIVGYLASTTWSQYLGDRGEQQQQQQQRPITYQINHIKTKQRPHTTYHDNRKCHRILSLNSNGNKLEHIGTLLKKEQPGILCMQETRTMTLPQYTNYTCYQVKEEKEKQEERTKRAHDSSVGLL